MNSLGNFKQSRESNTAYIQWRSTKAQSILRELEHLAPFENAHVLDIGCGFGVLTHALLEKGARVTATEVNPEIYQLAKEHIGKHPDCKIVKVSNEHLPGGKASYDWVMVVDTIEHVSKPSLLVKEIKRVLKPKGLVYVEFTPYYSIVGHHLYDLTLLPIHLLSKELVRRFIYSRTQQTNRKNYMSYNADDFWEIFNNLNKLSVDEFVSLMKSFKTLSEHRLLAYPDRFSINIPWVKRWLFGKDWLVTSFKGVYQHP